ncbi:transmembrane protease serine 9 isoform X1 [Helicoverpa armigera]|uniref:transmembrane protease serine 9 isoform X1 n=1 Tax=Helicoverpa armigera TaxID=29058 RepID=UPI001F5A377E|nr:transmembrane protease serine 9 isoform X1 [Helicoverpa armigera]XP_047032971.1 transmembrane protease serine 9-like isoform X1 [Helicoverpa zea]
MITALTVLALLAVPTFEQDSQGSTPISPCPNVFMYEPPGSEPGRWYGVVNLSTDSTLHSLWLNIVLDNKADILGNWVGDVSTTDNKDFKIENAEMQISPGPAVAVRFFVQFNPLNKTPRLQAIRLNGREICNANTPRPVDNDRPDLQEPVRRPTTRPNMGIDLNTTPVRVPPRESPSPVFQRPSNNAVPANIPNDNPSQDLDRPGNGFVLTTLRPDRWSTKKPVSTTSRDTDYWEGPAFITLPAQDSTNSKTPGGQAQCGKVVLNPIPLVVNGTPTLEGQWPWQIALYQTQTVDNKYICGGTLVTHRHVITAAHCVTRKQSQRLVDQNTLTVYLGKHNLRTSVEGVQVRFVGKITVHPDYNATTFSRDVAILELREPVQYSDWIRPACLWPDNEIALKNVIGKKGSVVGWGFDDTGVATEELSLVEMPVVSQETCIRSYSEFFVRFTSDYTYCAGYRDGLYNEKTGVRESTSVCNGDSGGGMVFRQNGIWYLRGLVSLSVARQNEYRCDPTHYVIFTDLAKFLPWIYATVSDF